MRKRCLVSAALWMMTYLAIPAPGNACVRVYDKFEVAPTFSVEVVHRNRPVPSLRVQMWPRSELWGTPVREGQTDDRGSLVLKDLPPGRYGIEIGSNTAFTNFAEIQVIAGDGAGATAITRVRLNWNNKEVLRFRRFRGVLKLWSEDPARQTTLKGIEMQVSEVRSRNVVSSITTSTDGRFDLSKVPKGLYVLEIKPRLVRLDGNDYGLTGGGYIPLEITSEPDASVEAVDLVVSFTDCGLMYETVKSKTRQSK